MPSLLGALIPIPPAAGYAVAGALVAGTSAGGGGGGGGGGGNAIRSFPVAIGVRALFTQSSRSFPTT